MSPPRLTRRAWFSCAIAILLSALPAAVSFGAVIASPGQSSVVSSLYLPVSPAETASRLLSQSLGAYALNLKGNLAPLDSWSHAARANLEHVLKWAPGTLPVALPSEPLASRDQSLRRLESARKVLESVARLQDLPPAKTVAVLSDIFDGMNGAGLVPEALQTRVDLESAVRRSGLAPEARDLISRYSKDKRPVAIDDFLRKVPLPRGGYLLGTTDRGVYGAMARATGLTHYNEVYAELFGRIRVDVTDKFLDFLHKTGETVAFLVPNDSFAHPQARMTKEELEWYIAHPEKMANVSFIFGAYDFVRGDALGRQAEAVVRGLELWRGGLEKSPDESRIAQRRAHHRSSSDTELDYPTGDDRRSAISEFIEEGGRAQFAREKASVSLSYFQTDRGTYIAQEVQRGLFLMLYPSRDDHDKKPREVFIPRSDATLFWRVKGSIPYE